MGLFKNVNVVYYYVSDWERAKKFYRELLAWPVVWSDDQIGWEEYGLEQGAHVAISRWGSNEPLLVKSNAILVLTVDNCQAVTDTLRAKGIRCDEVVSIPGVVTFGACYDPDGNCIQFAQSSQA
jgi:predicted enzyme related to lactoylglutathione lyase